MRHTDCNAQRDRAYRLDLDAWSALVGYGSGTAQARCKPRIAGVLPGRRWRHRQRCPDTTASRSGRPNEAPPTATVPQATQPAIIGMCAFIGDGVTSSVGGEPHGDTARHRAAAAAAISAVCTCHGRGVRLQAPRHWLGGGPRGNHVGRKWAAAAAAAALLRSREVALRPGQPRTSLNGDSGTSMH